MAALLGGVSLRVGLAQSDAKQPKPKTERVQWEYRLEMTPPTLIQPVMDKMNTHGSNGWELASIVITPCSTQANRPAPVPLCLPQNDKEVYAMIYKRPKTK